MLKALNALLFFLTLNGSNADSPAIIQTLETDNRIEQTQTSESIIDTTSIGYKLLNAAKKYYGVPYALDGRSKNKLDCMGLIFLAYSDVTGKSWRNLSVYPSKLVKSGKLGQPVKSLDGIAADSISNLMRQMEVGDIIYLLISYKIIKDDSLAVIDSVSYWPWHMGMYAGNGNILHANPCASEKKPSEVIAEPLQELLERTGTRAIFVTRMKK